MIPSRLSTPTLSPTRALASAALLVGSTAAFTLFTAGDVRAQSSKTQGLVLGGHLEGASMVVEDSDRSNGGGGGFLVGWAFENGLGLFAQLDASNVDVRNQPDVSGSWRIAHLDLGTRYHFRRPDRTVVPYLQAAFTFQDVRVSDIAIVSPTPTDELDLTGTGLTGGGGVMLHVTPSVAFEFGLLFSWGTLDEAVLDGETIADFGEFDLQSSRLNLGLAWWPTG
jgi:hypothetical protein